MKTELTNRVIKEISKLEKTVQNAIFDYLESLEPYSTQELYDHGAKDLKGNLKGLIRFKDQSFKDHRLVGTKKGDQIVIILCCEPRRDIYKNKEKMAKNARKK